MLSPTINSFRSEKRLTMLSSRSCCISFNHYSHHIKQSFTDCVGFQFPRRALVLPLAAAISTQHKGRVQAGVSCEFDVAIPVADHPTSFHIDFQVRRSAIDE